MEGQGREPEDAARRTPGASAVGAVAMLVGALLLVVAAGRGGGPPRPHVLGEALVATTTTLTTPAPSGSPATSATAVSGAPATPTSAPRPPSSGSPATTTVTTAPAATATTRPPKPPATTRPSCPSGAPAAELRTWEAHTDGDGVWHVSVRGVVTNRTGAAVAVDHVAIRIERANGSSYDVPADDRPAPDPTTVADRAESTWQFDGVVPAGASPKDVRPAIAGWRWTDAPSRCG